MSLLRTKAIRVGSLLAFTDDPAAANGVSLLWGNPAHMSLSRGDVVQVLSIEVGDGTTWAKVQVVVIRGKAAARVGHVSIDMGERRQRCWQALTATGSMAPIRCPKGTATPQAFAPLRPSSQPSPPTSETRVVNIEDVEGWFTTPMRKTYG